MENYKEICLSFGRRYLKNWSSSAVFEFPVAILSQIQWKLSFMGLATLLIARKQLLFYMRSLYSDGRIDVRLVSSKSRVAPLKKQSIPRLKLQGAVLLARLVNKFNSTVKQLKTINWIDSLTALCWIKNARMSKQFVQNRVDEICSLTSLDSWRHCPGDLNPADISSRELSAKDLSTNTTWWNGTSFLYLPESAWPEIRPTQHESNVVLQEAVKNPPSVTHSLVNTSTAPPEKRIDQGINVNQFSDLTKLLRATALVLTFVRKVKSRAREI